MAYTALTLINGIPTMTTILPNIYDQTISVVASGATPPTSVNGPVSASTALTLPASGTYTVSGGVPNLIVYLNGKRLEYTRDWSTAGTGPNFTQIQLTFGLVAGDYLDLEIERNS